MISYLVISVSSDPSAAIIIPKYLLTSINSIKLDPKKTGGVLIKAIAFGIKAEHTDFLKLYEMSLLSPKLLHTFISVGSPFTVGANNTVSSA
jgi:hypothetical protein